MSLLGDPSGEDLAEMRRREEGEAGRQRDELLAALGVASVGAALTEIARLKESTAAAWMSRGNAQIAAHEARSQADALHDKVEEMEIENGRLRAKIADLEARRDELVRSMGGGH